MYVELEGGSDNFWPNQSELKRFPETLASKSHLQILKEGSVDFLIQSRWIWLIFTKETKVKCFYVGGPKMNPSVVIMMSDLILRRRKRRRWKIMRIGQMIFSILVQNCIWSVEDGGGEREGRPTICLHFLHKLRMPPPLPTMLIYNPHPQQFLCTTCYNSQENVLWCTFCENMEYRVEQLSIGPHRNPPRSESSGSGTKNSMSRARVEGAPRARQRGTQGGTRWDRCNLQALISSLQMINWSSTYF